MAFPKLFSEIFRDYVTSGNPASGAHPPIKADIRAWAAIVEAILGNTPTAGWDTWTPTVTSNGGTLTSYTVNFARYRRIGRDLEFIYDITITDAGTGTGLLLLTTPAVGPSAQFRGAVTGREIAVAGWGLTGYIASATIQLAKYDGTTAIATSRRFIGGGFYEAAS